MLFLNNNTTIDTTIFLVNSHFFKRSANQQTFTCSKSTTETLEKGMKYVQSQQ